MSSDIIRSCSERIPKSGRIPKSFLLKLDTLKEIFVWKSVYRHASTSSEKLWELGSPSDCSYKKPDQFNKAALINLTPRSVTYWMWHDFGWVRIPQYALTPCVLLSRKDKTATESRSAAKNPPLRNPWRTWFSKSVSFTWACGTNPDSLVIITIPV